MTHQTLETRLGELIPRDALRQLVALLEECQRRALARNRIPKEIRVTLELGEPTGEWSRPSREDVRQGSRVSRATSATPFSPEGC